MLQGSIVQEVSAAGLGASEGDASAALSAPPLVVPATPAVPDAAGLPGWLDSPAGLLALLTAACVWPRRRTAMRERRRLLHIISSDDPGATRRQLVELVNRIPAGQYDIDVLIVGPDDGELSRRFKRSTVRVSTLPGVPGLVSTVLAIRWHCLANEYDLVHAWSSIGHVAGVAGARLAGVPRVVAAIRHGRPQTPTPRRWWSRAADALCARAADALVVNARVLEREHATWAWCPIGRISLVHTGLEPSHFLFDVADARCGVRRAAGLADDALVMGTAGALVPEADHLTFLRTLRSVREARPDVHGIIIGDGPQRAALDAAVAELELAEHVTFLGEREDVRALMAGFDLFLQTSAANDFPHALLEAAFLGVPAVASRSGGNPDVLSDAGNLFEPGNSRIAAARVLAMLAAPSLTAAGADRMRHRAFALFTADRMAKRWRALYHGTPEEMSR